MEALCKVTVVLMGIFSHYMVIIPELIHKRHIYFVTAESGSVSICYHIKSWTRQILWNPE